MNPEATLKQAREAVEATLLPDRVTITHPGDTPTVTDGVATFADETYTYKGSTLIPCRFDIGRAQRNEMLDHQEAVASEWVLHLPYGFKIRPNDKISLIDNNGGERRFEMKKAADFEKWGVTYEYIVTELEFQHGSL